MKKTAPSIHVAILGGAGYGAGELLRLLTQHPHASVVSVTSTSQVGRGVTESHPHLRGFYELPMTEAVDFERLLDAERSVVFCALPHGHSGAAADAMLREVERRGAGVRTTVIDLSGDLRLRNASQHRQHYPESPELGERRAMAVYGLPELQCESIRTARLIANPGCLASAAILALAPLANELTGSVAIDAKTGSSGSGRELKATTHHPTRHADFRAYKPLGHQHEPEILQALGDANGSRIAASFVAQSMDCARGIYVSAHATLATPVSTSELQERYRRFYSASPFVRMCEEPPTLQDVVGSNFCDIAVVGRDRQVVAMAALDNLIKGMAGTAIQNMNLACGLKEATGLWTPSFRPV